MIIGSKDIYFTYIYIETHLLLSIYINQLNFGPRVNFHGPLFFWGGRGGQTIWARLRLTYGYKSLTIVNFRLPLDQ